MLHKTQNQKKDIHIYKLTKLFSKDFFGAVEFLNELAEYLKKNPKPEIIIQSDGTPIIHVPRKNFESICQWKYKEESHVILIEYFSSFN